MTDLQRRHFSASPNIMKVHQLDDNKHRIISSPPHPAPRPPGSPHLPGSPHPKDTAPLPPTSSLHHHHRGPSSLTTTSTCPAPTCLCAATPSDLDIDRVRLLRNTMAPYIDMLVTNSSFWPAESARSSNGGSMAPALLLPSSTYLERLATNPSSLRSFMRAFLPPEQQNLHKMHRVLREPRRR